MPKKIAHLQTKKIIHAYCCFFKFYIYFIQISIVSYIIFIRSSTPVIL